MDFHKCGGSAAESGRVLHGAEFYVNADSHHVPTSTGKTLVSAWLVKVVDLEEEANMEVSDNSLTKLA